MPRGICINLFFWQLFLLTRASVIWKLLFWYRLPIGMTFRNERCSISVPPRILSGSVRLLQGSRLGAEWRFDTTNWQLLQIGNIIRVAKAEILTLFGSFAARTFNSNVSLSVIVMSYLQAPRAMLYVLWYRAVHSRKLPRRFWSFHHSWKLSSSAVHLTIEIQWALRRF